MAKIKVITVEIDGAEFDIGDVVIMDAYGEIDDKVLVKGIKGEILRADDDSLVLFIHSVSGLKIDESAAWMSEDIENIRMAEEDEAC